MVRITSSLNGTVENDMFIGMTIGELKQDEMLETLLDVGSNDLFVKLTYEGEISLNNDYVVKDGDNLEIRTRTVGTKG